MSTGPCTRRYWNRTNYWYSVTAHRLSVGWAEFGSSAPILPTAYFVGARTDRPALAEMLAAAGARDTVVVTRLDRLGRSLPDLLGLVENLATRDVGLRSLAEQIDTTSATGRLVLHVFAALAEFERALMHERTMAGLAAARARGRIGGRPKALTGARLAHARQLADTGTPVREIAVILGVARSTV